MAGTYGITFAQKLLAQGQYDQAIEASTQALTGEPENPEHFADRATALGLIERHDEAIDDYRRALLLDASEQILDEDMIDDALFSTLLRSARERAQKDVAAGVARLDEYATIRPHGRHLDDARDWQKRIRGELQSTFVKQRD